MTETLAFLRAVNVGKRSFPAADIRRVAEQQGYSGVETHINTGNLFVRGSEQTRAHVEHDLEAAFFADRGFEVPVISFTPAEFRSLAAGLEAITSDDLERHYVYLLKEELSAEEIARITARDSDAGRTIVQGRAAHVLLSAGYRDGQVDPLGVAKLFGVATNRNRNVVRKLAEKWT